MAQLDLWGETLADAIVNVASVPLRSPFRYPGGKTWLIPRIRHWLRSLPAKPKRLIEPFAGGAIVGLTAAFEGLVDQVILVERDEQVAAVWDTIINKDGGAEWLANRILNFDLTPNSVDLLMNGSARSDRETAFRTIVQNRISHGGILADGAGLLKYGENGKGILSRWYPKTLSRRILDIGRMRNRIAFIKGDGLQVIRKYDRAGNVAFFVDPPYTASSKRAGARLYRYHEIDHDGLFEKLSRVNGDFLMTYDDSAEARALALRYRFERRLVSMSNTHHAKMTELLIGRNLGWVGPPMSESSQ